MQVGGSYSSMISGLDEEQPSVNTALQNTPMCLVLIPCVYALLVDSGPGSH